jgi:hypothetical protein
MIWRARLFLVFLWLSFVGLWYRVYWVTTAPDVTNAVTYLSSVISAYSILVTVWILHNIAIYRRKGPRSHTRVLQFTLTHDQLRSYISARTDLKNTQAIAVQVVDGRKTFSQQVVQPSEEIFSPA